MLAGSGRSRSTIPNVITATTSPYTADWSGATAASRISRVAWVWHWAWTWMREGSCAGTAGTNGIASRSATAISSSRITRRAPSGGRSVYRTTSNRWTRTCARASWSINVTPWWAPTTIRSPAEWVSRWITVRWTSSSRRRSRTGAGLGKRDGSRSITSISRPTRQSDWRTGNGTNGEVGKFDLYNGTIELTTVHVRRSLVSGRRVGKLQSSFPSVLPSFFEYL